MQGVNSRWKWALRVFDEKSAYSGEGPNVPRSVLSRPDCPSLHPRDYWRGCPRWCPPRRYPLHLHPVPGDHRTDRREVWPPSSSLENHSGSPLQGAPANVHPRLLGCKTVIRNTTSRLPHATSTFSFGNSRCYWKRPLETSTAPSEDKAL